MSHALRSRRQRALAAALAVCCNGAAHAATIHVDDAGSTSIAGKCTLPDAVAALNGALAVNACAAGDGNDDTITLAAFTVPTTILFSQATSADGLSAIGLTRNAHLVGPLGGDGKPLVTIARNTAPGMPKFRVLGTTAYLALDGVAITGGDSVERGGGVAQLASDLSYQYLRISHSVISGNNSAVSGGGLSFDCATTYIQASTISGNTSQHDGGGIYSTSKGGPYDCYTTLGVLRSTIADNTAVGDGGGIFEFAGILNVAYSTIDGNSGARGGASYGYGHIQITNATISGNAAAVGGGAVYATGSIAYIASSTIVGNTCADGNAAGGIAAYALQANAIILRGNTGADLQVKNTGSAYALSGSNNIIHNAPTPNTASATLDCDPQLGALADNGGPTQTMSIAAGSCALDAGPVDPPSSFVSDEPVRMDQRGAQFLRKSGSAVDIGAFELQPNERIFYDGLQLDTLYGVYFPPGL